MLPNHKQQKHFRKKISHALDFISRQLDLTQKT